MYGSCDKFAFMFDSMFKLAPGKGRDLGILEGVKNWTGNLGIVACSRREWSLVGLELDSQCCNATRWKALSFSHLPRLVIPSRPQLPRARLYNSSSPQAVILHLIPSSLHGSEGSKATIRMSVRSKDNTVETRRRGFTLVVEGLHSCSLGASHICHLHCEEATR